ncbi:hypothetical protein HUU53_03635 [Candidatus Micrarchaeota archaeon]|nr:hypothetical protein [Candidatus Micrarchaeota archaeon]
METYPNAKIDYVGVDAGYVLNFKTPLKHEVPADQKKRLTESFHDLTLDLRNPRKFEEQLRGVVGGKLFDEIHAHLPFPATENPQAKKILLALSKMLVPGGRFYHLIDGVSPFLDFKPVKKQDVGERSLQLQREATEIRRLLENTGLELVNYGKGDDAMGFPRRTGATINPFRRGSTTQTDVWAGFREIAARYSTMPETANHFLILKKTIL